MNVQCTLVRNGQVVLAGAVGTLFGAPRPDGGPSWVGHFMLPPGHYLGAGTYVLRLDDGQTGDISIASVLSSHLQPARVDFIGRGAPR